MLKHNLRSSALDYAQKSTHTRHMHSKPPSPEPLLPKLAVLQMTRENQPMYAPSCKTEYFLSCKRLPQRKHQPQTHTRPVARQKQTGYFQYSVNETHQKSHLKPNCLLLIGLLFDRTAQKTSENQFLHNTNKKTMNQRKAYMKFYAGKIRFV